MRIVRLLPLLCGLLWSTGVWTAPVVVAELEFSPGRLFPDRADILLVRGVQPSKYAGRPRALWTLRAGDKLRFPTPPAERTIRFYRVNGKDVETVCTVLVKYVADSSGWRPVFHMLQQPIVAFDGQKVVPLGNQNEVRGLMQARGLQTPDREGFYRELVFGYTSGPTTIDGWEVQ